MVKDCSTWVLGFFWVGIHRHREVAAAGRPQPVPVAAGRRGAGRAGGAPADGDGIGGLRAPQTARRHADGAGGRDAVRSDRSRADSSEKTEKSVETELSTMDELWLATHDENGDNKILA